MLVLTRKQGEEILVGRDVVVRVCKITPTTVSIAIGAPEDVRIVRREIMHGRTPDEVFGPPIIAPAGPLADPRTQG
jgi:carbon storage regulator CsrA